MAKSRQQILDKLKSIGILGAIRQRLGAEDEKDTSRDDQIMTMNSQLLIETWAGWELGDESWATGIIGKYNELKKFGLGG